ncbi:BTAD domain-containing putative transcriptional regulator [Actinosynnema sp. NPDC050436]|uniref:AfsR/SARP family transcriptional regulator n=1 Tax=Actinosynnema sp. NPDC050436 TaxID=3155659 RepID=UPI0033D5142B
MVEIRLLGAVEVVADGRPVQVGPPRQRHVLAALLAEVGRPVRPEVLVDRVWGSGDPRSAAGALHTYISQLRRVLAPFGVTITREPGGYLCRVDPDAVDIHRFAGLVASARAAGDPAEGARLCERALALWRGEPVFGLDTAWADRWRSHLEDERAAAESERADLLLRSGRPGEVLPALAALVADRPLDERSAAQYVTALYRSGRQADALAHYHAVRARLADELGAEPSPNLRAAYQSILSAEGGAEAPSSGRAPRPRPVPRQLPPAPAHFVGRAEELARLTERVREAVEHGGTVLISALAGAGGIGKTWLALHWGHAAADRFPDGQLFVDLRGFSPEGEPLPPGVALRGFLDALGADPTRVPADPQAQAALYRSLVADKRMLVVLDNAATTEQLVPLLPGTPACTVLVTSRRRLTGLISRHGAHHLNLRPLSDDEARALLTERAGRARALAEPDAVADLLAYCRGFPLALSLVGARAGTDPRLPLSRIAAELRESGLDALDDDEPTGSLPTVLSWSQRALTAGQREAFALLGTAPGPDIGLSAAASLLGHPPAETRRLLRTLAEASLLDHAPHDRYAMHDLIRAHAETTAHRDLAEDVRVAALRRVVDFYTHTADAADRLVYPHSGPGRPDPAAPGTHPLRPADISAAMAWFDAEHAQLIAAQQAAVAHGWHDAVWHLFRATVMYRVRRGRPRELLASGRAALGAAEHLPDPAVHIHIHRFMGSSSAGLGLRDPALEHMGRALELARDHDDATQRAHVHYAFAGVSEQLGDNEAALAHATAALELFRTLDHPAWHADALNSVGWYNAQLGRYTAAREHCLEALALHRRHRVPDGEAATLDSLAYVEHRTGDHHAAVAHYSEALALHRALGNTHDTADILDRLAHPRAALGRPDLARAAWSEALRLYRDGGRHDDAARVQQELNRLEAAGGATPPTP